MADAKQIPFGVFAHEKTKDHDSLNVVLGLQDSVSVRAYDYEDRRPLWYLWQNAIVDTVNVHDFFFCIFLTAFKSKPFLHLLRIFFLHLFQPYAPAFRRICDAAWTRLCLFNKPGVERGNGPRAGA